MIRHGTRNPSAKVIRAMNTDLYKFKDQILSKGLFCEEDKALFKSWESNLSEDEEKNLVAEGEDELIDLGERFQNRFPQLLSEQYDNYTYKVSLIHLQFTPHLTLFSPSSSNSLPRKEQNEVPKDSPLVFSAERISVRFGSKHLSIAIPSSASTNSATAGGRWSRRTPRPSLRYNDSQ